MVACLDVEMYSENCLWVLEASFRCLLASGVLLRYLIPLWFLMLWMESDFSLWHQCCLESFLWHQCYEIVGSCALVWHGSVFIHVLCTWWTISVLKLKLCSSRNFLDMFDFFAFIFHCFLFSFSSFLDIYLLDQSSNFFLCFLCFIYPLSWYFFNFPSALLLSLSSSYFIFHFQELFFVLKFFLPAWFSLII